MSLIGNNVSLSADYSTLGEALAKGDTGIVVVWNSLAWERTEWVGPFVVACSAVSATRDGTSQARTAVLPSASGSSYELWFEATLPALGYASYFVQSQQQPKLHRGGVMHPVARADADFSIENEYLKLDFAGVTGRAITITNKQSGVTAAFTQDFLGYIPGIGDDAWHFESLGKAASVALGLIPTKHEATTNMQRVTQQITPWITNQLTLRAGSPFVEVTMTVGPCQAETELVTRFTTDLATNQEIFGDEYGMESRRHNHDMRFIEGNFYPMVANAFVRDTDSRTPARQLTLLSAHSHGAAALYNGTLEVMLARHGTGSYTQDSSTTVQTLWLMFDEVQQSERLRPVLRTRLNHNTTKLFGTVPNKNTTAWLANHQGTFTALAQQLPQQLHMTTLKRVSAAPADGVILRVHHIYEGDAPADLAKEVDFVPSSSLSSQYQFGTWEERVLTATVPVDSCVRKTWKQADSQAPVTPHTKPQNRVFALHVSPMEIRTAVAPQK
eukprot:TRINITY_DN436_c0_g1_i3.p1 TRINITY_DN436_c0_g1~~TRINITY_DN436_c0_g1_i3.p1  ORF type:complete len:499 (+),score=95.44 TRINITY_DN436_c0_g1_i3:2466-3962(+)